MATRCPSCFADLGNAPLAFRCNAAKCADEVDSVASGHLGAAVKARPVTTGRGDKPKCRACGATGLFSVCPACHAWLPAGWLQYSTTCVALAGARASGKSIYIAVLKRQAETLVQLMGGSLTYFDAATELTYKRTYEVPLYEQRGLIAPTARLDTSDASQRLPMIFSMGTFGGRPHKLVIRDVAGENLEDPAADPTVFSFFRNADAVLFLFDPMRVEQIRHQLAGVVPEQRAVGGDPYTVLTNLIRLMRVDGQRIRTPLAVVLAKFDTLYELRNVTGSPWAAALRNPGATYSRDRSLDSPVYDNDDGELLDAEVASLLTRLDARHLLQLISNEFESTRMFAVSALGAAPSGQLLHPRGIAPFRVLDPLKWILPLSIPARAG